MRVAPNDADYTQACLRVAFIEWARIKAKAVEIAAERLLAENSKRTKELIEAGKQWHGAVTMEARAAYLANEDEISRLFDEHDQLLGIAFPRARPTTEGA